MISFSGQSGVTGGMFIPILCLGALCGKIFTFIFNEPDYKVLIITVSMVSFLGASVGCPLSAVVFAMEVLGGTNNILSFVISVFISYAIYAFSKSNNVYDIVLERKLKNRYSRQDFLMLKVFIDVEKESFAVNKLTRDLLLPTNTAILSIQRKNKHHYKMDNSGEKTIEEGDRIIFQIQTYDLENTKSELEAFFGKQDNFHYKIIQEKKYKNIVETVSVSK